MLCETLTMILVVAWAPSFSLGIDIVSKIGIPMILGSVCIGFIVLLVQSVEGEKEASAARQAKLALDIANKTLPLFRHVNSESLRQVCDIIRRDINADAVAITNTQHVMAYVGVGEINYRFAMEKSLLKTMTKLIGRRKYTLCWSFLYGKKASSPVR
ncbi:sensor protein [Klebsiella pneumoniae]|nr:sensor protein [Klebsiella pneumoniae]